MTEAPLNEIKADLFKGLSHPVRIRVLELLADRDELAVSQMLEDISLEASHLSQHLAVLRRYGLVVSDRRASQVYYRLAHDSVADLLAVARRLLGDVVRARGAVAADLSAAVESAK